MQVEKENRIKLSGLILYIYKSRSMSLENKTYFFITVSSRRSILFCTRTVGISPTSASTFSLQLSMAWNDSRSVVEKTSTHAWAPGTQIYNDNELQTTYNKPVCSGGVFLSTHTWCAQKHFTIETTQLIIYEVCVVVSDGCLTTIVGLGDGVKLLLTGGVPQHQSYFFTVDTESTTRKFLFYNFPLTTFL